MSVYRLFICCYSKYHGEIQLWVQDTQNVYLFRNGLERLISAHQIHDTYHAFFVLAENLKTRKLSVVQSVIQWRDLKLLSGALRMMVLPSLSFLSFFFYHNQFSFQVNLFVTIVEKFPSTLVYKLREYQKHWGWGKARSLTTVLNHQRDTSFELKRAVCIQYLNESSSNMYLSN